MATLWKRQLNIATISLVFPSFPHHLRLPSLRRSPRNRHSIPQVRRMPESSVLPQNITMTFYIFLNRCIFSIFIFLVSYPENNNNNNCRIALNSLNFLILDLFTAFNCYVLLIFMLYNGSFMNHCITRRDIWRRIRELALCLLGNPRKCRRGL